MKPVRDLTITLLAIAVIAADTPAAARDDTVLLPSVQQVAGLVEHMPPVMRAAYMMGIREELIAHGYDPGPDNGAYDDRFTSAIQRYQMDAGLRPDGIASKALLEHLLFAIPKIYADGSRAPTAHMTIPGKVRIALAPPARVVPQLDREPVPSAAPRTRVTTAPLDDRPAAANRSRFGARRKFIPSVPRSQTEGFVSRTQRALRNRGYYHGPIDGRFSDSLSSAIRAFQKNNRLPITGVIDAPLIAALS